MIFCVKIGERKTTKTETQTWTTSHFTWGEGSQQRDHMRTITYYTTTIELYVDNIDDYIRKNGQTSDLTIYYIPNISDNPLCLSDLTGMMIVYNFIISSWQTWAQNSPIAALGAGLYLYIKDDGHAENHKFVYERIKITDCLDNLILARAITAITSETKHSDY